MYVCVLLLCVNLLDRHALKIAISNMKKKNTGYLVQLQKLIFLATVSNFLYHLEISLLTPKKKNVTKLSGGKAKANNLTTYCSM